MGEDLLLEKTLEIADQDGYESAYDFLLEEKDGLGEGDYPQVWYFLCCLASGSGKLGEAISWLKKAVEEHGYWYRSEIFDDNDLEPLISDSEYISCKEISDMRYQAASKNAVTCWTLESKQKKDILLCLHGNGQTANISLEAWKQLVCNYLQVEALQSHTVDSYSRYRWNYDDVDYRQVIDCAKHIMWEEYEQHYLAGFSAGCDMILRAITLTDLACNEVFLQSPWIPFSKEQMLAICNSCKDKNIGVHLYCGDLDDDCKDMAISFYDNLQRSGVRSEIILQRGLRHQFPEVLGDEYKFFVS